MTGDPRWLRRRSAFIPVCIGFGLACLSSLCVQASPINDFTPQERKEFHEGSDRFPKFVLPLLPMGGALWLDNDRLIMSVIQLPTGWRAATGPAPLTPLSPALDLPAGLPRIIVVDATTGKIGDAPYPGTVVCASDGTIVISLPADRLGHDAYFSGRYGTPLTRVAAPPGRRPRFDGAACGMATFDGQFWNLPLLPRDGVLRVGRNSGPLFGAQVLPVELVDANGRQIAAFRSTGDSLPGTLRFLPYSGLYVTEHYDGADVQHAGSLLSRDGKLTFIDPDPFLHKLTVENGGSSAIRMTRKGLLWNYRPPVWRKQGLYLREDGQLFRLEDQSSASLDVSPDGCRVSYQRINPNPAKWGRSAASQSELVVLTLCR